MEFQIPEGIKTILEALINCGFQAYVVGGAVRDIIQGKKPKDYDITTNASTESIASLFDSIGGFEVSTINAKSYQIVSVNGVEIATFRKDIYHNGELETTIPVKTLYEDTARRDFTVNSMAIDITGQLYDYHGGQADLAEGLIRFNGNPIDRIIEDPNRIIRAARFVARIEGKIENETLSAIKTAAAANVFRDIAQERIRIEILKALQCDKPSIFFNHLNMFGLLRHIFPTLDSTVGLNGGKQHREEVYDHGMICGDYMREHYAAACRENPMLLLAAYLHDVGKAFPTFKDGEIHFYGHEQLGADHAEREMKALTFTKAEVKFVTSLIRIHMDGGVKMSPKSTRKLLYKLNQAGLEYTDWIYLRVCDRAANLAKGPYSEKKINKLYKRFQKELDPTMNDGNTAVTDIRDLAISGTKIQELLNIGPSQIVGAILQYLLDRTILDPSLNNEKKLVEMVVGKYPKKPVCPIHKVELECLACNTLEKENYVESIRTR